LQYHRQVNRHSESESKEGKRIATFFALLTFFILHFAFLIFTFSMALLQRV